MSKSPKGTKKHTFVETNSHFQILDVSCNNLTMFPEGIYHCKLSELHCDENPLLEHLPVLSQNINDVYYLKVHCHDKNSYLKVVMVMFYCADKFNNTLCYV